MTWAQLRRLRAQGFTIGSHTVSHIDCAAESEGVVKGELAQSRDDIRRLLEVDSVILAYPYGGRDNMTAARLEWVKQAGYVGCLSAYGGVNKGAVDPFNVLRRSINWEFSDRAFLCRCFGL
jgi:peptidoglycan/xylan/chitin deacetylase (PgdA/CDA1 family)